MSLTPRCFDTYSRIMDVSKECLRCVKANKKKNWDTSQSCPTRVVRVS